MNIKSNILRIELLSVWWTNSFNVCGPSAYRKCDALRRSWRWFEANHSVRCVSVCAGVCQTVCSPTGEPFTDRLEVTSSQVINRNIGGITTRKKLTNSLRCNNQPGACAELHPWQRDYLSGYHSEEEINCWMLIARITSRCTKLSALPNLGSFVQSVLYFNINVSLVAICLGNRRSQLVNHLNNVREIRRLNCSDFIELAFYTMYWSSIKFWGVYRF